MSYFFFIDGDIFMPVRIGMIVGNYNILPFAVQHCKRKI